MEIERVTVAMDDNRVIDFSSKVNALEGLLYSLIGLELRSADTIIIFKGITIFNSGGGEPISAYPHLSPMQMTPNHAYISMRSIRQGL
jgi:hypothetical protein